MVAFGRLTATQMALGVPFTVTATAAGNNFGVSAAIAMRSLEVASADASLAFFTDGLDEESEITDAYLLWPGLGW